MAEEREVGSIEEFLKAVEEDELKDQVDAVIKGETEDHHQTKMTVIDYAKTRTGLSPQLVYYYIRGGKIKQEKCICGRWVIDIISAEEFFNARDKKQAAKRGVENV
jgi:hypothetical protein